MRLFSQRGYHAASMEDLAQAVGLRRGSLYTHITGKSELLAATVEHGSEAFNDALERGLRERSATTTSSGCGRALRAHIGVVASQPDAAACFLWEWRHLEGERARARDRAARRLPVAHPPRSRTASRVARCARTSTRRTRRSRSCRSATGPRPGIARAGGSRRCCRRPAVRGVRRGSRRALERSMRQSYSDCSCEGCRRRSAPGSVSGLSMSP